MNQIYCRCSAVMSKGAVWLHLNGAVRDFGEMELMCNDCGQTGHIEVVRCGEGDGESVAYCWRVYGSPVFDTPDLADVGADDRHHYLQTEEDDNDD